MKHRIAYKIIAILLATCGLTVTLVSGLGIAAVVNEGLYFTDYENWVEQFYANRTERLAIAVAESYSARQLGNLTDQALEVVGWGNSHQALSEMWGVDPNSWAFTITTTGGALLEKVHPMDVSGLTPYTHTLEVSYPTSVQKNAQWHSKIDCWEEDGRYKELYIQYRESPTYAVTVWITPGGIRSFSGLSLDLFAVLAHFKYALIVFAAAGLLLTILCLVYLCCAAGKSAKCAGVRPVGLNRLPLDVYAAALGGIFLLMLWFIIETVGQILYLGGGFLVGWCILALAAALVASLCMVAGVFALAAQWKMHNHYVWNNSLIGRIWSKAGKLFRLCWTGLCKLYSLLPLIWQYLLIAFVMAAVPALCLLLSIVTHSFGRAFWMLMLLASIGADIILVSYGAYAYGTLLKAARNMAEGDLHNQVDTRYLRGSYQRCAEDLNALADVAVVAAKKQMQSDRMKTELITNVSHDIKTPLTSVINYIDLLQRAENPEQSAQYLEILDRQAQKLKKLIDDLMEMSKATTGDMPVEIAPVDGVEAVTQALGEFADKLEQQALTVVFRKPEAPVIIQADGRLVWRVLSNLMSNIVKYALPGTRVYAQVEQQENRVCISLKNISREELNVSAAELTERFVRGDVSRNTEGSGLGLNIAKSLMELQKGQLALTVDGDLFKVTLTFPAEK